MSVDASGIKSIVDKQKTKFFAKLGFLKPKREEIDCEAISLYYEPFHVVKARYYVDYYKKNAYNIKVDEKVIEEVFEVSENTLIYTPIYEARCRYLKTGEIKIIPISGVTGKPFNP